MGNEREQAKCGPNVLIEDGNGVAHKITLVNTSQGLVLITPSTIVAMSHGSTEPPVLVNVQPMASTIEFKGTVVS